MRVEALDEPWVGRRLRRDRPVVDEIAERPDRGIRVVEPRDEEVAQGRFTGRCPIHGIGRRALAAEDVLRREGGDRCREGAPDGAFAEVPSQGTLR
ncbi:MAG: hypothetical protein E6I94_04840 [Chloroflexi bacterium]|nr:MAG: hypothetical protein E6I94_04840 [Chloroflexota bacterium]